MNELCILTNSPKPVYEQIIEQIKYNIQNGGLKEGDSLPPIRQLATDLELNPNTVAKSFKILENDGLIETFGRKGTFITKNAKDLLVSKEKKFFALELEKIISNAKNNGIVDNDIKRELKKYF